MAVAQELGYEAPAARLVEAPQREAQTIGVVVPDVANPVFGAFVKAAQGEGWHYGQTVVLVDTDFSTEREREAIVHPRDRVDGLVVCSPRLDADTVLELSGRVPAVPVNREAAGADCIVADTSDGLRQTVDYLRALGHKRVAYVQGSARCVDRLARRGHRRLRRLRPHRDSDLAAVPRLRDARGRGDPARRRRRGRRGPGLDRHH